MSTLYVVKNPGLITASSIGLALEPTLDASGGLESADTPGGAYLKHKTGAQGGSGGLISSFDAVQLQVLDEILIELRLDANAYNNDYGYWIGLFSVRPVVLGLVNEDPTVGEWAGFRVLADGGNVQTVTRNNGTGQTTKKPDPPSQVIAPEDSAQTFRIKNVTPTPTSPLKLEFYFTQAGASSYTTHDAGAAQPDHLPAPDASLAFGAFVIASAAVDRSLRWKVVELKLK